ncbi:MAG: hypothetical protein HPY50_10975 [Firmicutes bacterium]|nr:hypothetical protein [Bacillota bacterium]
MKKIIVALVVVLTLALLAGCGEKNVQPAGSAAGQKESAAANKEQRIEKLVAAWKSGGLKAEIGEDLGVTTAAKNLYGAVKGYLVIIEGGLVVVMEFDPDNLNSVARNYLSRVEAEGSVPRRGDGVREPHWKNQEFTLMGSSDLDINKHPHKDKIVEIFKSFK